ncbi:hypothetical protein [Sporolactobacillus putidus]|uniref:hypothetical protein n=1 Tax=Sporolactobacillus putidus TaxID=492735 RepID=UPI0016634D78|nr:hypothetical protein [Sporolactobacillus putidus]
MVKQKKRIRHPTKNRHKKRATSKRNHLQLALKQPVEKTDRDTRVTLAVTFL